MKKNSLATAIIAGAVGVGGMVGASHAINLNPDGLGQVLLYPYYTVNGGNSTVISVVNTTDEVKAVKVRFVEALNSAEVLDFNLYLSPYDVWTANVVAAGENSARLMTNDRSCTVPQIVSGTEFLPWEYMENNEDILWDLGLPRVRQGHLEIIEMGVIDNSQTVPASTGGMIGLAAAATHAGGVPRDCAALERAWNGGVWGGFGSGATTVATSTPSGGLFGSGVIVSAEFGRTLSYNADAIDAFYTIADSTLHYPPGDIRPSLAEAASADAVAPNIARANVFNRGQLHTIDYEAGIDGVSAVLMADAIYNEYNLNEGLDAASEWVITFPTKRTYVHRNPGTPADQPFTSIFPTYATSAAHRANFQGSCHVYGVSYWDREERTTTRQLGVSPPRATPGFQLCWEANVLAFGQVIDANTPTRILGATSTYGGGGLDNFQFEEGWARIQFDSPATGFQYYLPGGSNGQTLIGQPVTGFWASEVVNNNVEAGVRANFGVTHKHRASRDCRIHDTTGDVPASAPRC